MSTPVHQYHQLQHYSKQIADAASTYYFIVSAAANANRSKIPLIVYSIDIKRMYEVSYFNVLLITYLCHLRRAHTSLIYVLRIDKIISNLIALLR